MKMNLELRKSYIFSFFILLHVVFWDYSNGVVSTLIHGDWVDQWQSLISRNKEYYSFSPWEKFFYLVQLKTGLAVYFGIIFFSFINTCLFILFVKILEVFDNKYNLIAAILVLGFPSSMVTLSMMYKDNLAYLAFAIMLFVIARFFANKPLNLVLSLSFYFISALLISISRMSYVPYLTLLISLSLFILIALVLIKSNSYKNLIPLLFILFIHLFYFYSGYAKNFLNFISYDTATEITHSHMNVLRDEDRIKVNKILKAQLEYEVQEELNLQDSNIKELLKIQEELNQQELLIQEEITQKELNDQELSKIQDELQQEQELNDQELLKIQDELKQQQELNDQELLKIHELLIISQSKVSSLNEEIHNNEPNLIGRFKYSFLNQVHKFRILTIRFFAEIKHRKISNLTVAPNATFNYDTPSSIMDSKIKILVSHLPTTIFAPYIAQILDMNSSSAIKLIFLIETFINYILAFSIIYFLIKQKLYRLFFVIIVFSCMYITNLFDTNFGTYLRHAYLFNKLFLSMGFLGLLYFIKPKVSINLKKGFL